jgi:hypothetical protein
MDVCYGIETPNHMWVYSPTKDMLKECGMYFMLDIGFTTKPYHKCDMA